MKDKGHYYVSLIKSIVRIVSCICSYMAGDVFILALGFGGAEVLGIVEEVLDERG